MLMINNYIKNPNRFYFTLGLLLRVLRRIATTDYQNLFFIELSLRDYRCGLNCITLEDPYKYITEKRSNIENIANYKILFRILKQVIFLISNYTTIKDEYLKFRQIKLTNSEFWIKYLKIN